MTFEEYRQYDALGLAQLVRDQEVTAKELLDIAIARAEAVNPKINAIVHPLYDLAANMLNDHPAHAPFSGVPFLIKDLGLSIKDTPLRNGSKAYQNQISSVDSYEIERFRAAGLLFMGKTNTPEFGLTPYTEPRVAGATRNPWNLERTAGGSSGGSAAAVAAGITPIASASDGGGSIRIPASNCGLFGLKTSRGRVSLGPLSGDVWGGAVVNHVVTRSVRDSAAMLDATQGDGIGELHLTRPPLRPYLDEMHQEPGKLRIAFSTQHTLGHTVDPECIKAVEHTVKLLTDLGHHVEEATPPYQREDLTETFIVMIGCETAATLHEASQYLGRPVTPADVEPATYAVGLLGKAFTGMEYAVAKNNWNDLARRMGQFHQQYDVLLTPVTGTSPFTIGKLQQNAAETRLINFVNTFKLKKLVRSSLDQLAEKTFAYIPWTPIANMTGQPSMSIPLYWTPENLPVGSMFTAAMGREDTLFRLASQLEQAQPWIKNVADL
jgi:amidase